MLEAIDYKRFDNVTTFLGAIMGPCCDTVNNCRDTSLFTFYADPVSTFYRRSLSSAWNKAKFGELDKMIKIFQRQATKTLKKYQPSRMCASKTHLLDHISVDTKAFCNIFYLAADLYEYSHQHF